MVGTETTQAVKHIAYDKSKPMNLDCMICRVTCVSGVIIGTVTTRLLLRLIPMDRRRLRAACIVVAAGTTSLLSVVRLIVTSIRLATRSAIWGSGSACRLVRMTSDQIRG